MFSSNEIVVLDGATGTELDRLGLDLSMPLWSARAMEDNPSQTWSEQGGSNALNGTTSASASEIERSSESPKALVRRRIGNRQGIVTFGRAVTSAADPSCGARTATDSRTAS